jgi:hypothetical protein
MIFRHRCRLGVLTGSTPNLRSHITGTIAVHEFITLDGVIEDPHWTRDYPFDSAQAIRGLKESIDDSLYVSGSATQVRALLADGLVDDLHLRVPADPRHRPAAVPGRKRPD